MSVYHHSNVLISSSSVFRGDPKLVAIEVQEREHDLERKKADDEWQREFKLKELESRERIELAKTEAEKARAKADEAREEGNIRRDKFMEAMVRYMQSQIGGGGAVGPAK